MAVVTTLSKAYDLDYTWKQVDRGPATDAASYYIQASESGGEPPGRWWGIPSEDPDYADLGQAFPPWRGPARGAIFQPPMPEIPPSPQTLQRVMDYDADWEATD